VLAFDTATDYLSLALRSGNDVIRRELKPGTGHAKILFSEIDGLLLEAGMTIADIELLGVGVGPGSFTGVRVGVSAAQAIAYARSLPVIGVSSLAAMAAQSSTDHALVIADARMNEVYAGLYRISADQPVLCGAETVQAASDLVLPDTKRRGDDRVVRDWSLIALGWPAFADQLTVALSVSPPAEILENIHPRADIIAGIAQYRRGAGAEGDSLDLVPSYVRNQVAKVSTPG